MSDKHFHPQYPFGIAPTIDPESYRSVVEIFDEFVQSFHDKPVFSCMGQTLTFSDLDSLSNDFAAWALNDAGMKPGDRIAVQLPNILQFPVVVWGALKAGLVVVNTNPLYTDRELIHQFNDSGAKVLIVYAGMAAQALRIQSQTGIQQIVVTEIADFHPGLKRMLVNTVVKKIKKMVPDYDMRAVLSLRKAMSLGHNQAYKRSNTTSNDVAVLQYTGGTTGVSKGAMLTHRNLVANLLQSKEFFANGASEDHEIYIAPLPLYHIYAFLIHGMLGPFKGIHSVLIPNPRDIPGFVKEMRKWKFTGLTGLNTLFVALMNNEEFQNLDFSHLNITMSGGMALTEDAATRWEKMTGCTISEGYGMTETSPVISGNPQGAQQIGTIGIPVPSTAIKIVNDKGEELPNGEAGELWAKGPQVMKGYWNRPDDTAKTINDEGYIATGDIAIKQDDGYYKIVDRKKDMIIVSGFNVYPNEIENVLTTHPNVIEAAVVGAPDELTGEVVRAFVVVNSKVSKDELIDFCRDKLTAYKLPRQFEFKDELPKTNVGKILRRELR